MQGFDPRATGVIVVDHGSRWRESNDMLLDMAQMIADHGPYSIVEPAHMELAEPSIATAFARCVQRGAQLVLVSPFFLLPGRHWTEDLPRLTAEAARSFPEVSFLVAAPLGLHPLLPEIMVQRLQHCLQRADQSQLQCDVCERSRPCVFVRPSG